MRPRWGRATAPALAHVRGEDAPHTCAHGSLTALCRSARQRPRQAGPRVTSYNGGGDEP